ncbi:hypothetical protein HMN09_00477700 [Mycena chlorophos]|uniref:F-box domain-containing protein n=1 Tax=Mycena chlorophos TaxID=658473 RepID=A0A8H6TF08_MYCCL|nr:hypothetical protein HMN09_00477700 [Mycena chlorophos]
MASNIPPADIDISLTRSALTEIKHRLSTLNTSIDTLRSALDAQKAAYKSVKRTQRAMKSVLSPIRRLPAEILGEIFVHYTKNNEGTAPWKLGHICHSWRIVALGLPALWAEVHVLYDAGTTRKREATAAQLSLCSAAPLSFRITFAYSRPFSPLVAAFPASLPAEVSVDKVHALSIHSTEPAMTNNRRLGSFVAAFHLMCTYNPPY